MIPYLTPKNYGAWAAVTQPNGKQVRGRIKAFSNMDRKAHVVFERPERNMDQYTKYSAWAVSYDNLELEEL